MKMRAPGACLQCVRSKRKCDHGKPRCGRCVQGGLVCEKQDFKPWKHVKCGQSASRFSGGLASSPSSSNNSQPWRTSTRLFRRPGDAQGIPIDHLFRLAHEAVEAHIVGPLESHLPSQPSVDNQATEPDSLRDDDITAIQASQVQSTTPQLLPALSTMSSDLRASPRRLFLWQYFIDTCSHTFRCWTGSQDPFSIFLPAMAASDSTVRSAALAFSADCYNKAYSPSMFSTQNLQLEALGGLIQSKANLPALPDSFLPPLAAALLLYRFDEHSRGYLLPLARSALKCIRTTGPRRYQECPQYHALAALLAWTDICAYTSLVPQTPLSIDDDVVSALESDSGEDDDTTGVSGNGKWITHPIYGFSSRLVSPLLKMGRLIQARRAGSTENLEPSIDALEVELLLAHDHDHGAVSGDDTPSDPTDLLHVNEAMHAASFIMFYTRLRDMPFTAQLIRRHVAKVQHEAACVGDDSLSSRALVFPLFIAGCEAVDGGMRALITARLLKCTNYAVIHTSKISEQLERVWKVRDEDPGQTWFQWTENSAVEPIIIF